MVGRKLTDQIKQRDTSQPFYTFEFFPPRTDQGFENLMSRISRLAALNPLAMSVTWGAGGSTKERSLELAGLTQSQQWNTILHLTCTNMEQGLVDKVLKDAKEKGIRNILALRGDPPRGEEEWVASDSRFTRAVDLVSYIRSIPEYADWFCIGVAGYPDGHGDGLFDAATEIEHLKQKIDAGADFIITQLFYDVDHFLSWLSQIRQRGINVPVIPGIMPIQTYGSFARVTKLCGTRVPEAVAFKLAEISHDDQVVKEYGITLAVEMTRKLHTEGGVQGFHFCTLNLEKSVQLVLEKLSWTTPTNSLQNKLIVVRPLPHFDLVVTASTAVNEATINLSTSAGTDSEAGRGELNNAASWDDFPNGRFGDFKSPAFGNQDMWGNSGISRSEVLTQWAHPNTLDDLTNIFLDHLHSKISTTPFSPTPLSAETLTILPHLERLTKGGWWTVGSQPAVDGVNSTDEVFGWGPRAGYIFQKGFVEFFCEEKDVDKVINRIDEKGKGWVHYFAGNVKGECCTNVPEDGRNAVTWGVFPGQEIVQTTIIERESFLSWLDEAFSIWTEWASFYRPDSSHRRLLEGVRDSRWLVSVVHHDYKDPDALWKVIFDDNDN
ncbi:methylenetetrahydrofolate reductase-domain-containing protein [Panaeolus papilionaceus]|nr:methylenetetrahydrofolate reductase-domain-containing protein [Panaeolus papilionaceus]